MTGGQILSDQRTNSAAFCFLFKPVNFLLTLSTEARVFNIFMFILVANKWVKKVNRRVRHDFLSQYAFLELVFG